MTGLDLSEIAITSGATLSEAAAPEGAFTLTDVADVAVVSNIADGAKCERCWMVMDDVGADPDHPDACGRCAGAVKSQA